MKYLVIGLMAVFGLIYGYISTFYSWNVAGVVRYEEATILSYPDLPQNVQDSIVKYVETDPPPFKHKKAIISLENNYILKRTWIGPWVFRCRIVNDDTGKSYYVPQNVPNPIIVDREYAYIPTDYNLGEHNYLDFSYKKVLLK